MLQNLLHICTIQLFLLGSGLRWHKDNSTPLTLPEQAVQPKVWVTAVSNCIGDVSSLWTSIPTIINQISPDCAISSLSNSMCSSALQGTP